MNCFGDGKCMALCNKLCSAKIHEVDTFTFCKVKCKNECELIPCKNWLHCKTSFPSYFYKLNNGYVINGVCVNCSVFNITFLKEKRECYICSKPKYMIVTHCNHEMCFDCLMNIREDVVHCPFCASEIKVN